MYGISNMKNASTPATDQESAANLQYLAGRRAWNSRFGGIVEERNFLRKAFLYALITIVVLAATVAYLGSTSQIDVWIVTVDKQHRASVAGRPGTNNKVEPEEITTAMSDFVVNARSVFTDRAAQRLAINRAYAFVNANGSANQTLQQFHSANDPFARAEAETVEIELQSTIPVVGKTIKVEWKEVVRGRDGTVKSELFYEMTATYAISPPKTMEQLMKNARGIYISEFRWAQRL